MIYNASLYYRILISIGIVIFSLQIFIKDFSFDLSLLGIISSSAGITLILDLIVIKVLLWKLCPNLFYTLKLINTPFLGGEWEGIMKSDYIDPDTQKRVDEMQVRLQILHSFDKIHVKMTTDKAYSSSHSADVTTENSEQKFLNYIYSGIADKNKEKNPRHYGASRLRILFEEEIFLEGTYWTDRKTAGTVVYSRKTKKSSKF